MISIYAKFQLSSFKTDGGAFIAIADWLAL